MDIVILKQHYHELCEQLGRLQTLLQHCTPAAALVAQLPAPIKGQENEPIVQLTPSIYSGADAVQLALEAYQDLHIIAGLSQKSARRMPGVIYLDTRHTPAAAEIAACVQAINSSKLAIKDYVVSHFKTASARFEILKQACPGVMTVHLYRLIRCYQDEGIKSVRFTWSQQQALVYPDKDKLLARIRLAIEQSSSPDYTRVLTQLQHKISAVAQGSIRVRRQVKVQPVANVTWLSGAASPVTAPLPMIILQDTAPALKIIGDFDAQTAAQRKTRSDKIAAQLLGTFQGETIEYVPHDGL